MHAFRRWLPALPAALLALTGCSSTLEDGSGPPPPGQLLASDKQRQTAPGAPAEDLASAVTGNTDFGVALYRQSAQPGQNVFFSPFSITQALAMTYAGARGTTETQMAQALRFSLPQGRLHPAMNALDLMLQGRSAGSEGRKVPLPELRVVNATWAQQGLAFEPTFLDVLAQHYGAGVRAVDFTHEPGALRTAINAWVEGQTNGHIQDLLPEGAVKADTRLVLTNALYFKGAWAAPFLSQSTHDASFHLLEGGETTVRMMQGQGFHPHMRGEGFEALALPYEGGAFRMLLIVPDAGRFTDVEARLSASFLDGVRAAMVAENTALGLPRFEVKQTLPLTDSLQALGMVDAFSGQADLSGMTKEEKLAITRALHQAFVSVNEAGTEATAATAIIAGPTSVPQAFTVDRPFLFLIEDVETKAVLFLGRFVKP